jgi:hypothetical protein
VYRTKWRITALCILTAYPLNVTPPAWVLMTPPVLEQPTLITWDVMSGLLDGCEYVVYRLSPGMIAKLREHGLAALEGAEPPSSSNRRNPYSAWSETPIAAERPPYALRNASCNGPYYPFNIEEAARRGASFYSLSRNKEGLWFVDSTEGLVIYRYFG